MSILEDIQENIQFRVQSARAMIMGGSNRQSASPIDRRRKIMEKNRELLMGAAPSMGEDDINNSSSTATVRNVRTSKRSRSASDRSGSGVSVTRGSRKNTSSGESYIGSKVKDMSRVKRGTAQRASDRGFN